MNEREGDVSTIGRKEKEVVHFYYTERFRGGEIEAAFIDLPSVKLLKDLFTSAGEWKLQHGGRISSEH